jgi:arylsulfatase A-like enzyme
MTDYNVVLVVMDTARFRDVHRSTSSTETIDNLSLQGQTFSNTFSSAPWTLPSHASLFTGTYSSKHGAHAGHKRLDGTYTTLAEAFASADYETAAVSNNTWISEEFGFERGFEHFQKTWQYVQSETDLGEVARMNEGGEMIRKLASRLVDGNPFVNLANAVYGKFLRKQDDDGAKQTNEWIGDWLGSRRTDRPFFLFVNYLEPHLEYRPPKAHAEQFLPSDSSFEEAMAIPQDAWGYIAGDVTLSERDFEILQALYRAEISYLDERIGELRALLKNAGEWEDTVFVVTGDHGENIGDHGLMDHQYCLYDTLLHVPLVIHGGPFTGGSSVDELVQLIDLVPTLLDVAEINAPGIRDQLQGRSFHPDSPSSPREYAIAEYMSPQPSMDALEKRVGSLSEDVLKYNRSLRAIRTTEHKLIRRSDGQEEFYRVGTDSDETTNLVDENLEPMQELNDKLDSWLSSFEHAKADATVSMDDETKSRLEDLGYLQ